MKIRVYKKETVYFVIKVFFTVLFWLCLYGAFKAIRSMEEEAGNQLLAAIIPVGIYVLLIAGYLFLRKVFIVGHLKGNGVEITEAQFPEVYQAYREMAENLGIKRLPPLFVVQEGGALNAFAVRLSCKNYIAMYSDIFDMIETDAEIVNFILAHELAHVKRHHISKKFWTLPASIVPFLGAAYSRSCEYTCDNIAADLHPEGAEKGLLVLAAGKGVYKKVNADVYLENAQEQKGFAVALTGLCSSHPFLPKRIRNIRSK